MIFLPSLCMFLADDIHAYSHERKKGFIMHKLKIIQLS